MQVEFSPLVFSDIKGSPDSWGTESSDASSTNMTSPRNIHGDLLAQADRLAERVTNNMRLGEQWTWHFVFLKHGTDTDTDPCWRLTNNLEGGEIDDASNRAGGDDDSAQAAYYEFLQFNPPGVFDDHDREGGALYDPDTQEEAGLIVMQKESESDDHLKSNHLLGLKEASMKSASCLNQGSSRNKKEAINGIVDRYFQTVNDNAFGDGHGHSARFSPFDFLNDNNKRQIYEEVADTYLIIDDETERILNHRILEVVVGKIHMPKLPKSRVWEVVDAVVSNIIDNREANLIEDLRVDALYRERCLTRIHQRLTERLGIMRLSFENHLHVHSRICMLVLGPFRSEKLYPLVDRHFRTGRWKNDTHFVTQVLDKMPDKGPAWNNTSRQGQIKLESLIMKRLELLKSKPSPRTLTKVFLKADRLVRSKHPSLSNSSSFDSSLSDEGEQSTEGAETRILKDVYRKIASHFGWPDVDVTRKRLIMNLSLDKMRKDVLKSDYEYWEELLESDDDDDEPYIHVLKTTLHGIMRSISKEDRQTVTVKHVIQMVRDHLGWPDDVHNKRRKQIRVLLKEGIDNDIFDYQSLDTTRRLVAWDSFLNSDGGVDDDGTTIRKIKKTVYGMMRSIGREGRREVTVDGVCQMVSEKLSWSNAVNYRKKSLVARLIHYGDRIGIFDDSSVDTLDGLDDSSSDGSSSIHSIETIIDQDHHFYQFEQFDETNYDVPFPGQNIWNQPCSSHTAQTTRLKEFLLGNRLARDHNDPVLLICGTYEFMQRRFERFSDGHVITQDFFSTMSRMYSIEKLDWALQCLCDFWLKIDENIGCFNLVGFGDPNRRSGNDDPLKVCDKYRIECKFYQKVALNRNIKTLRLCGKSCREPLILNHPRTELFHLFQIPNLEEIVICNCAIAKLTFAMFGWLMGKKIKTTITLRNVSFLGTTLREFQYFMHHNDIRVNFCLKNNSPSYLHDECYSHVGTPVCDDERMGFYGLPERKDEYRDLWGSSVARSCNLESSLMPKPKHFPTGGFPPPESFLSCGCPRNENRCLRNEQRFISARSNLPWRPAGSPAPSVHPIVPDNYTKEMFSLYQLAVLPPHGTLKVGTTHQMPQDKKWPVETFPFGEQNKRPGWWPE